MVIIELELQRNETLKAAYSDGTKRNLATHWEAYSKYCKLYQDSQLQATIDSLSLFIQYLSNKLRSPGAISNYLSGVKTMHIIHGFDTGMFDDFLIKMMLKGILVTKKYSPKKAAPITTDILRDMYMRVDTTAPNDCTFWALYVIAFFLLARKSNLVPDTVAKFDASKQLTRGDIQVTKSSLVITLKWSKTNQTGRKETFPLIRNAGNPLCPVRAYQQMVAMFPADNDAPAFLLKKYGVIRTATYRQFQDHIKESIKRIGLDPTDYSSHSFRRGGATYAFQCGLSPAMIKKLGDWKSDSYREYIDFPVKDRIRAGKRIRRQLNKEALVR